MFKSTINQYKAVLQRRDFKPNFSVSQRHERRIEQLIGYSITGEGDASKAGLPLRVRLDLLGRLTTLERRVNRLEQDNHGVS